MDKKLKKEEGFDPHLPAMAIELKRKEITDMLEQKKDQLEEALTKMKQSVKLLMQMAEKMKSKKEETPESFECPSCRRVEVNKRIVTDSRSEVKLCQKCFLDWVPLYLDGKVKSFRDVVPESEC